jgi:3-dehydroquinate dehydratase I
MGGEKTEPSSKLLHQPRQTLSLQQLLSLGRPLIIGTLHEASGLKLLKRADALPLDLLEARLDSLSLRSLPANWPLPMIATARHPDEGGKANLSLARRRELLEKAISWASALDIELRSARELAPVIASAHQHGRSVILSHHDFEATPTLAQLRKLTARAADQGAELFKVATFLENRSDLQRLIEFQMSDLPIPVTTMGMGPAGRFSRLVLCGFGAPLCYGWLGKPQVPGQWPALELAGLLAGMLPS